MTNSIKKINTLLIKWSKRENKIEGLQDLWVKGDVALLYELYYYIRKPI